MSVFEIFHCISFVCISYFFVLSIPSAQLQQDLLVASDKERAATEIAVELKSKVKALDVQLKTLRSEKLKLETSLDEELNKNKDLKELLAR